MGAIRAKGLKICIDCSPLLVRSAGVKTYLYHWLKALRNCGGESIATFLEPRDRTLDHPAGARRHFFHLAALWALNRSGNAVISKFVPEASVFHASNLLRTFPGGPKLSATLHDLTSWTVPQFHTPAQRSADEAFADAVLRPAAGLICVSENSRRDAERILGLNPRKMTVIYPGVPDPYFDAGQPESEAVTGELNLRTPYFLFVSTIEPRKNLDGLLSAWLSLPAACRRTVTSLVVAGIMLRLELCNDTSKLACGNFLSEESGRTGTWDMSLEQLMPWLTAGPAPSSTPVFTKDSASRLPRRWPWAARLSYPVSLRCRK